jgi:transcriptional regulator with XRE-family HTH domain
MLPMGNFILSFHDLAKEFKAERKALGFTQSQVAQNAGLRRETIIQIEAGENVQAYSLLKAISALGKAIEIVDRRIDYDHLKEMFDDS